jgi:predicted site-specific integrase-resolvase
MKLLPPPPPLMTAKGAAEALGVDISTIRRYLASGELDAFQATKRGVWRIHVDEYGLPRFAPHNRRATA